MKCTELSRILMQRAAIFLLPYSAFLSNIKVSDNVCIGSFTGKTIWLRYIESVLFLVTTQDNSGRGQTRNMTILVATRIAFLAVRRETVNSGRDLLL